MRAGRNSGQKWQGMPNIRLHIFEKTTNQNLRNEKMKNNYCIK